MSRHSSKQNMNMDSVLKYQRSKEDDLYAILGCDELSTVEQMTCEYKVKALACHPDKHPDDPNAAESFALLQRAKEILTDPAKRKDYDRWRKSGIAISYKEWLANKNSIHTSMHWASQKKKEPMLEEGPSTKPQEQVDNDWASNWRQDTDNEILRRFRNYDL